jgi:rubrerythrin
MEVVARFHDAVTAQQLVSYLQAHGVEASTEGGLLESFGPIVGAFKGQYAVGIIQKEEIEEGKILTERFLRQRPILDETWEHDVDEPDLNLLDPALLPDCPSCGLNLMSIPANGLCPSCGTPLDLVALIFEQHGPEALEDCYPKATVSDSDEDAFAVTNQAQEQMIRMMEIPCARCRYSLRGLDLRGTCPECGQPYDKAPGLD